MADPWEKDEYLESKNWARKAEKGELNISQLCTRSCKNIKYLVNIGIAPISPEPMSSVINITNLLN